MPTYIDHVKTLSPIFIANSTGATIVDQSTNAHTVNQGVATVDYSGPAFHNTSLSKSIHVTQASVEPPSITHTPTSDDFTVALWIKSTDTNLRMSTSVGGRKIGVTAFSGIFGLNSWNSDCHGVPIASVLDGKWHHVVMTADASSIGTSTRIWVDGEEQSISHHGSAASRSINGVSQLYFIGGSLDSNTNTYIYNAVNDDLACVSWWDSHLSDADIVSLFDYNLGEDIDALTGLVWGKKPMAYWKFFDNDPSGVVADLTPNANNLGIYGSHTRQSGGLPGESHGAKTVLNPGGYAHTSFDSKWDVIGVSQYSVEMWLEVNSLPPATSTIMGFGSAAGMNSNLMIRSDLQSLRWEVWNVTSLTPVIFNFELNTLYHIVFTQDTDGRRMYVNGTLIGFHSTLTEPGATSDRFIFNFNEWEDLSRNHYTVYEVAYYKDRALTPVEVSAHNAAAGITVGADNAYKGLVMAKNPVAYYPLDVEALTSTELYDMANGYTITLPAGTNISNTGLNSSNCYNQNNSNSAAHIELPIAGQSQVSIEGWVKRDTLSNGSFEMLFGLNAVGAVNPTFRCDINTASANSTVYASTFNAGAGNSHADLAWHDLNVGEWYHLVINCDLPANRVNWYLNGVFMGYTTWVNALAVLPPSTGLTIGAINNDSGFGGCFQHLAVYTTLLTPAEIKEHYRARVPALEALGTLEDHILADDPIGYFPLDATTGTVANNLAGGRNGAYQVNDALTMNAPGLNLYQKPLQRSTDFTATPWIDCGDPVYFGMKDSFTFEQVFTTDTISGEGVLLSFIDNGSGGFGLYRVNDAIRVWFYTGSWSSATSSPVLNTTDLFHIIFTFDGQFAKVYLNGVVIINHNFGTGFNVVFNKLVKLTIGCAIQNGATVIKPFDGRIAHTAVYDHVVPEDRHMARTRIIHGDTYATSPSPYFDTVIADEPFVYYPLNDKHGNFRNQFNDMGTADNVVRIGSLNQPTIDSYAYDQPEIVVGGGPCIDAATDNKIIVDQQFPNEAIGDITIEAWVNMDSLSATRRIMAYGGSGESLATNYAFVLEILTNGTVSTIWEYNNGSNEGNHSLFPSGTIQTNQTYHIVMVRNNATKELYGFVNGVKSAVINFNELPEIGNQSGDNKLNICGGANGTYAGKISHVAVYDKVLSDAKILDHYQAGTGNAVGPYRQVTGTVTEDAAPVERNVFVYDRADGSLQGQTQSSAVDGTFDVQWRNPDINKRYFIVVLDDDGQTLLDPVSRDRIEALDV